MPYPKGTIDQGAALTNSFDLVIDNVARIKIVKIGSLDTELKTTTLADTTAISTGKVDPIDTTIEHYPHHGSEIVALEAWHAACRDGAPGAKRSAMLHMKNAAGDVVRSYLLSGVLNKGRTIPELDAAGDGDAVMFGWKLSIDEVTFMG